MILNERQTPLQPPEIDALLQAKEQWERTFDSVPDLVAILDDRHRIVRVNRAMAERLAVSAEACRGRLCYQCIHGTDEPPASCPHASTIRDSGEHAVEIHAECLGGDFLVTTTPLLDERGRLIGSVHVARDIGERKRAEEALRKSKEQVEQHLAQLQAIVDNLHEGVVIADPDGNLLHWNPAALAMHSLDSLEECRRRLTGFEGIFELSTSEQGILRPEQWPIARILGGETVRDWVVELRRVQTEWRRVFSYGGTLVRGQDGKPLLAVLSITDVTLRHRAEQALQRSNLRLELMADTAKELLATETPQEVVNAICCKVMEVLDCEFFFNFLLDEEQQRLHLNAWAGIDDEEAKRIEWLDQGVAICGCAAQGACRIVAEDIQHRDDPRAELVKSYGVQAYACHAMVAQGRVLGTVSFGTRLRTGFTDEELALMSWVADLVAIALQRKQMEESLRQSEAMLEAFFAASPGILAIADEHFSYIKTDRLTPGYFGLDRQSIVGKAMAELAPELLGSHGELMRQVIETGRPELNRELQSPVPAQPGEMAYWLASYFPVPLPGNKRGIGLMGVDITGKKKAEEALRRAHHDLELRVRERTEELASTVETLLGEISERERAEASLRRLNRLYVVLSEIDQAIVRASDRDSLFRDFCRIAVEHGGFLLAWVGLLDRESGRVAVVAASGLTAYLEEIQVTGKEQPDGGGPTGISIREGTYYICNDFQGDPCTKPWHEKGRVHGIRASASIALKEGERIIGALTLYAGEKDFFDRQHVALLRQMGADISFALENFLREARRREAEQALQQETLERLQAVEALCEKERLLIQQSRQAALGEMIGNIAHQWRQPLNTLGLMIQELPLCYEYGDFNKEYLDNTVANIMQVVQHMSQTIDDFRNFFRPEKEKVVFRARKVIDKAISIIDASLRENGIRLELSSTADPLINGYPNEYSQVILNVLLNARDAFLERETGQPLIEVKLRVEDGRSVVTIEDNAGGIADHVMESIFDPYFTTKGPDKGTGVGLYMSKVIMEKNMHGRLTARNTDRGAEFRIEV